MEDVGKVLELLETSNRLYSTLMHHELSKLGITVPQNMVLNALKNGPKRIGEIARTVDLSYSTVSGIIDRLERNNLVVRHRDQDDRRVVRVSLTEECSQLIQKSIPLLQEVYATHLFQNLSGDEMRSIENSLVMVTKSLQQKVKRVHELL